MSWTAIVPLKPGGERKSRLAAELAPEQRAALVEDMAAHVIAVLAAHTCIARIILLADRKPEGWPHDWIADAGRGLNPELEAARAACAGENVLIVHADVPSLGTADLDALLAQADAIAPDRHNTGTNALALSRDKRVALAFGPNSFAMHRAQLPDAAIIRRPGLADDVDTPEDLKVRALSEQLHR